MNVMERNPNYLQVIDYNWILFKIVFKKNVLLEHMRQLKDSLKYLV